MTITTTLTPPSLAVMSADERTEIDPVCGVEVQRASAPEEAQFDGQHGLSEPSRYVVSCIDLL